MNSKLSYGLWGLAAFLSVGVAIFSYRLLAPAPFVSPDVLANLFARPWLFAHAGFAATALLVGPFQFLPKLRARRPRLHRWMGRIYVFACLGGGATGLALAIGTTAGPVAAAGFAALALAWLFTTGQAFRLALARRFVEHRRWMVRSFALTFAAVTLRLYLPFGPMMGIDFMTAYVAIAWLCWVPNLAFAELYLARDVRRAAPAAA
ncbi:DUF2306 domain-containing protein [Phenylobacterium sp.]|jgi:uncharacterized membrane protein|uniref:DUF2306 domain-containing protein n=1 Tax=Phenylobacterium sp. TaxID=1871053 RepID=UPI002F933553